MVRGELMIVIMFYRHTHIPPHSSSFQHPLIYHTLIYHTSMFFSHRTPLYLKLHPLYLSPNTVIFHHTIHTTILTYHTLTLPNIIFHDHINWKGIGAVSQCATKQTPQLNESNQSWASMVLFNVTVWRNRRPSPLQYTHT